MVDVSDNRYVANVLHLFLISSSITGTKVVNNAHLWGDFRFSAHCFLRVKHSSLLTKDYAFSPSKSAIDIALQSDFVLWLGGNSIEGALRPVLLGEWISTGHIYELVLLRASTSTSHFADQYYFDFPFRKEATNTHYNRYIKCYKADSPKSGVSLIL